MTALDGATFSDVQFNRYIRDNLNECAPAKASAAGQYFVTDDVNSLAARAPGTAFISTSQTTTSTSYADLATVGPQVTVNCGQNALVFINCEVSHGTANTLASVSFAYSGATAGDASDAIRIMHDGVSAANSWRHSMSWRLADLNPGSHTFTLKYRVVSGTGTFARRELIVLPL
ncbi:hypothetical protein ACIRPT_02580 [Streptomyces sp. NPDC101227]|uniref:hypothetical protein n=1 Tax=Streptomyces sp. NPDC101227 TaxID=3366136 RepID=UPI003820F66F